jgi:hypothetical protein
MDSGDTSEPTSRTKRKQRIKECFYVELTCSNIAVQRTNDNYTNYMVRARTERKID